MNAIKIFTAALLITSEIYATDTTIVNETENSFCYGFEKLITTRYIDRGISNNNGLIVQPTVWISYNDFCLSVWGNIVAKDYDDAVKRNEVDYIISWSKYFDNFLVEPSVYYCSFPNQQDWLPTAESNIKFGYIRDKLEFYTNLRIDILEYAGSTSGDVGVCYELFYIEQIAVLMDFSSGWANNKFNNVNYDLTELGTTFHYLTFALSANYYLTENIYLNPRFEYWYATSELLKSVSGNSLSNLGLKVGIEF